MALSIAAIVGGGLMSVALAGGLAGAVANSQTERRRWASGVWRDVTLRNGVTEPSPFHAPVSSFNAPGMVEVFPRSMRPPSPAAVSVPMSADEQVSARRLPPPSVNSEVCNTPVGNGFTPVKELPELPLELSNPPHGAEVEICRQLYQDGYSQTKLIESVWGISKGGGFKYSEARRRFRANVRAIAQPALLASIEAEEVSDHA